MRAICSYIRTTLDEGHRDIATKVWCPGRSFHLPPSRYLGMKELPDFGYLINLLTFNFFTRQISAYINLAWSSSPPSMCDCMITIPSFHLCQLRQREFYNTGPRMISTSAIDPKKMYNSKLFEGDIVGVKIVKDSEVLILNRNVAAGEFAKVTYLVRGLT